MEPEVAPFPSKAIVCGRVTKKMPSAAARPTTTASAAMT